MSHVGLDRERYLLSEAESRRIFAENIVPTEFVGITGVDHPVVHFFGGQPGAGKSVVQGTVTTVIIGEDGFNSVASIIGDDLRPHHPKFKRLLAEDDESAAFYTDFDSGRWVEQAIAWVIEQRPHVILEGTFRRPEVTAASAQRFVDAGFEVRLHVLAVHKFVSRTRIFGRYFDQIRVNGRGRYTLPLAHDASYENLPASVGAILATRVFSAATAYSARGDVVAAIGPGEDPIVIRDAVALAHAAVPTADECEDLLGLLDRFEETFTSMGRINVIADLQALRSEIFSALR